MSALNSAPVPLNELERITDLAHLDLDYTSLKKEFDNLVELASKIAGTKVSLLNLIDAHTQWSVASNGIDIDQMQREESVCQYTIMGEKDLEIHDLSKDDRFINKFYVSREPYLKYYYGIPLSTKSGSNIGTLCVMDDKEHELTNSQVEQLNIVGDEIESRFDLYSLRVQLQKKVEKLIDEQRALSHDVRGPVSGIIGIVDLIKDYKEDDFSVYTQEMIGLIQKGAYSVLELTDQMLSLGNETLTDEELNKKITLSELKNKLEQLYKPQALAKKIDLKIINDTYEYSSAIKFSKLLQITGNLISNAIKFTPERGMVVVRQELIKEEKKGAFILHFTVSDEGAGMDSEKIRKILEGSPGSSKGSSGEIGYGLGLQLVRKMVREKNGEINFLSKPGNGTTVKVSLPV